MDVISRSSAKALGLKRFFTGVPCAKGHRSERRVSSGQCIECRASSYDPEYARTYNAKYRKLNSGSIKAYDRARKSTEDSKRIRREGYREKVAAAGGPKPRAKQSPEALKAKRAASWAIYYEQHKERLLARKREYNANDRESYLATQRAWREKNTARRTALQAKRKARQLQAVPGWFDELDEFVWLEASDLCIIRRDATGIEWNADHMIPLAAKKACGLHVASNCQVIPAYLNNWKHNKMVLTRPDEWLAKLAK